MRMDFESIVNALDPAINRASKTQGKNPQTQKKKKIEAKTKMVTKKEETTQKRNNNSNGISALREIVNMKRDKAVANELEEVIFNQDERRKDRESKDERTSNSNNSPPQPSIIQSYLNENPDKLKELTMEDVMKLSVINNNNNNGGNAVAYDPMNTIMMMGLKGQNGNNNNGGDNMQTEIMKMIIQDFLNKKNQPVASNEGGDMIKLMMAQMQQQNQLVLQLIANKNQPAQSQSPPMMKDLLNIVQGQNSLQQNMLMDKIKQLEYQTQGADPLGEAKRMMDYMKTFKTFFGGAASPDSMEHEYKMKTLEFEQGKQLKEEELKDIRMSQIGDIINKGIGTFADALAKPTADIMSQKLTEFSQKATNTPNTPNKFNVPPADMSGEIDLGDLDNLEDKTLNLQNPPMEFSPHARSKRFEIREAGDT